MPISDAISIRFAIRAALPLCIKLDVVIVCPVHTVDPVGISVVLAECFAVIVPGKDGELVLWVESVSAALEESKSPARLLLQVHDELIFECPDDKATIEAAIALIKDKMENAVKLNVPLRVSIEYGKNWGEFH